MENVEKRRVPIANASDAESDLFTQWRALEGLSESLSGKSEWVVKFSSRLAEAANIPWEDAAPLGETAWDVFGVLSPEDVAETFAADLDRNLG